MGSGFFVVVAAGLAVLFLLMEQNASGATTDTMTSAADTAQPLNNGVAALASAITQAEGSNPSYNNPGDLKTPGFPTFGAGIAIFSTPQQGLSRLYYQLNLIVNGQSAYYSLDMSIQQFADTWVNGGATNTASQNWALTIAGALGLSTDDSLSTVLGGSY